MAAPIVTTAVTANLVLMGALAQAAEIPPPAYQLIAVPHGVPSEVLYSVALQESGTRIRGHLVPWPWTLRLSLRHS